ncbi:hypothetical protein [Paraburkholderia nodosa]|uniref:hypothetical protein n=1 Tax=Paraburkholderia nodosa TaxID=392320 RepID=UPI0012B6897F|nr:hypothetical protein [Paraburkholderia nodosa]
MLIRMQVAFSTHERIDRVELSFQMSGGRLVTSRLFQNAANGNGAASKASRHRELVVSGKAAQAQLDLKKLTESRCETWWMETHLEPPFLMDAVFAKPTKSAEQGRIKGKAT